MLCYYPYEGATERITWHGGESTMLHHEVEVDDCSGNPCWIVREVQTLGGGIPTVIKELLAGMSDYYQHFINMHPDNIYATNFRSLLSIIQWGTLVFSGLFFLVFFFYSF